MKKRSIKGWIAIIIAAVLSIGVLIINLVSPPKQESLRVESSVAEAKETLEGQKESLIESFLSLFRKSEDNIATVDSEPIPEEPVAVPATASEGEPEVEEGVVEDVVQDEVIWHFYNLDLQDDDDKLNNYNFGPNPILENVSLEKVKAAIKGKKASDSVKVQEIIEMLNVDELRDDQLKRMYDDPKLGAADMAWMDSIAGTRYLGTFYSAAKEQWDVAMNDAADAWIEDEESYYQTLTAFEKWLDSATDVRIEYRDSGLTDQMYMNPYTTSGIPDIIVMETSNHEGWFIVYEFTIKETKNIKVAYRIDCGYQPTNVSKIMKIKAKPNPNNETGGSDPKPTPTPTSTVTPPSNPTPDNPTPDNPTPDNPEPDNPDPPGPNPPDPPGPNPPDPPGPNPPDPPGPEPEDPPKDKSQGTQVQPNDDPGPGEDTNSGVGSQTSTKEEPTNSNNMTQEEYKEAIEEIKEANEISRQAGDPNTPSYTPPQVTEETSGQKTNTITVDNDADTGNPDSPGSTSIDDYTNPQDSSFANDAEAVPWDGSGLPD